MKKENIAIIQMLVCAALWSIAGIFIKLIPWNAFAISSLRGLIAGITILVFIRIKGYKLVFNRKTVISGLLLAGVCTLFVAANKLTTAANAIVLQFTSPIFIVLISAVFLKQKIKRNDLLAVIFVMLGIALFFLDKLEGGYILGNCLAIAAGLFFACMFIVNGNAENEERFSAIMLGQFFTFLIGLPWVVASPPEFSTIPVIYLLILGVFQLGIPYILYAKSSEYCPPLACNLLSALEPLLNPVWVLIFDGEKPGVYALIGGIIVIGAVTVWCAFGNRTKEESYA